MFVVETVSSALKPGTEILALGTDTRQRISWSKQGKVFSLYPKKDFVDIAEFYYKACSFIRGSAALRPKALAFDPHPYFVCNKEAPVIRDKYFQGAELVPVFHHFAHAANFGIEAGKERKFISLAFDGTGYGRDGKIWGGEFFVYAPFSFRRAAHFQYLALPGNEAAIRQPWRIALAALYKIYGGRALKTGFDFLKKIGRKDARLLAEMVEKDFNTAYTSSCGRLFDAVSALLGIRLTVEKEAEAAVALEKAASRCAIAVAPYPFDIKDTGDCLVAGFNEMFKEIAASKITEEARNIAARRFHLTVAAVSGRVCRSLRKISGIKTIYCSGGVFINDILRKDIEGELLQDGFKVFFANRSVTTDSGISQGQIAAYCMER